MNTCAEGKRIARLLGLEPLSGEGGLFRRTHIDAHSSAIYFMLIAPDFSALHAVDGVEIYHWYAGSPLRLLLLYPGGRIEEPILGPDLAAGARPQLIIPAGVWQGSSPLGAWTLVGTTMAPPSTTRFTPVTHSAIEEARNIQALATSAGRPSRPGNKEGVRKKQGSPVDATIEQRDHHR